MTADKTNLRGRGMDVYTVSVQTVQATGCIYTWRDWQDKVLCLSEKDRERQRERERWDLVQFIGDSMVLSA
jgi:hypothetical protein